MKYAYLFLNGHYPEEHWEFYRSEIDQGLAKGMVVAVDGGLNIFYRLQRTPHCVIGDFDSVDATILDSYSELKRVSYPQDKDATDGELAVRYVIDLGYDNLEIWGGLDNRSESDQMLANIFLLQIPLEAARPASKIINARLADPHQRIYLISDCKKALEGKKGDGLSVISISESSRLTMRGTKWELEDQVMKFGSTRSLRNEFAERNISIQVKGTAVVVHRYA